MGTILSFIMHCILWLIVLFIFFNVITNIDLVFYFLRDLIVKIKKSYGNIRQRVCKKSHEVNDDPGAVDSDTELYDSSSVWED